MKNPIQLFNFLNSESKRDGFIGALGGLLLKAQGEDYQEEAFTNQMKRRKRKKNRNR